MILKYTEVCILHKRFLPHFWRVSHEVKKRFGKKLVAFGKNIRTLREKEGITQEELAYGAGISFTTINNLENGHLNPTLATIYAIADKLRVPTKELFDF